MEEEREIIEVGDMKLMWGLKKILDIKKRTCFYCKEPIKEGDKFSIFNKPTRLICKNILCLTEAIGEDEK